ncbi:MAG TPA: ATP-binding protein [Saprospiraceae bacterium]|nr:ATP-binding protein [Saprospiraceae bacterium]
MRLKDTPIQRKLMSVILLTCGVVLFLVCSVYIIMEFVYFRENLKDNMITLSAVIASNSSAALAFDSPDDAQDVLNALDAEKNILAACLYDNDGKIFAKYPAGIPDSIFPPAQRAKNYAFNNRDLVVFHPVIQKDEYLGSLFLKSDLNVMYEQLTLYAIIAISMIALSLLLAFLISKRLQKGISGPILALQKTARVISEDHDYAVRATKSGNDEIGALTDAFNKMLTQIERQNLEIKTFNQNLEQKVNERTIELKKQNEFVETIINSSVDLIVVFDKELRYMMINKRAIEFNNLHVEGMIGKKLIDLYPALVNSGMYEKLKATLQGEPGYDEKYLSPVSHKYFENYYIPLRDSENEIYGILVISHDINKILETNQELEKVNAELLKSNRDLEQFAYVASHDLQEPLRKIQTFTQLLGDNLENEAQVEKYKDKINQSSARMKQLIQDMLNFSRISNSEDAFVDTDLNLVLENLVTDFELVLHETNGKINAEKLPVINGIPMQLTQLFANIIGNSLKYTKRNPVIEITSKNLSVEELKEYPGLNPKQLYYKIQFRDNGIGFEPQYSEQIFAIFQRLHGKQDFSGTGIGLALCKKIVENHHGIIFAEGVPDEGSTFTIILPA